MIVCGLVLVIVALVVVDSTVAPPCWLVSIAVAVSWLGFLALVDAAAVVVVVVVFVPQLVPPVVVIVVIVVALSFLLVSTAVLLSQVSPVDVPWER